MVTWALFFLAAEPVKDAASAHSLNANRRNYMDSPCGSDFVAR